MRYRHILFALALLVTGLAPASGMFHSAGPSLTANPPSALVLGDIVVRGRLEPSDGVYELAAFSPAPTTALGEVLVSEGESVRNGELLATLRSRPQALAALEAARAAFAVAERRLELTQHPYKEAAVAEQEAAVRARMADLSLAEAQIHRSALLRSRGVASDETNDLRSAEVSRASAGLEQAKARLQATTEVPKSELLLAEAEVAAARARVSVAEQDVGLTEIRAPIDGTVLKMVAKSGELVSNRPIMYIGNVARLKVVAEVDERLAPRVRVGQHVHASLRGLDAEWSGNVSRVGGVVIAQTRPAADAVTGRGGRIVEVEAALTDQAGLPPIAGLELLVRIEAR